MVWDRLSFGFFVLDRRTSCGVDGVVSGKYMYKEGVGGGIGGEDEPWS
jgi:hypothetical protein